MTLAFNAGDQGILPDRLIQALAESGAIPVAQPFVPGQVQPASLDLRLGAVAYRVRASFLPGPGTSVGNGLRNSNCTKSICATAPCWKPGASTSCR